MRCQEIMKKDVHCVGPEDSVEAAARRMRLENVGFLPVWDPSKRVVGTVTDRDIAIRLVAEGLPAATPVREIMTREIVSCLPTDDVRKAEEVMAKSQKSRLMCTGESGHLVGVISLSDIAQKDDRHAARTLRAVSDREARP